MSTALIVIDVQESFQHRPNWPNVSNPAIVEDVNRLVAAARDGGHRVFWVLHNEPRTGTVFDPETGWVRFMDGMEPRPDEPVVWKSSHNAFTTSNLGQQLTEAGVTRVVIAGIQTEACAETTARVASDMGYEVVFVTEATATFPITRRDTGEVLEAAAVIERTEFVLSGRFARIATIDEAFEVPATV